MTYLLDTNTCIHYLRDRTGNGSVRQRFPKHTQRELAVCSIVIAGLLYGAQRSARPSQNLAERHTFLSPLASLPFDDRAVDEHARLRNDLERVGQRIGPHDMLIAAIALANNLVLVAHNIGEFSRIASLRTEDWE